MYTTVLFSFTATTYLVLKWSCIVTPLFIHVSLNLILLKHIFYFVSSHLICMIVSWCNTYSVLFFNCIGRRGTLNVNPSGHVLCFGAVKVPVPVWLTDRSRFDFRLVCTIGMYYSPDETTFQERTNYFFVNEGVIIPTPPICWSFTSFTIHTTMKQYTSLSAKIYYSLKKFTSRHVLFVFTKLNTVPTPNLHWPDWMVRLLRVAQC